MEEWRKDVAWMLIAIIIGFGIQDSLKVALHTSSPLVIVVSGSM